MHLIRIDKIYIRHHYILWLLYCSTDWPQHFKFTSFKRIRTNWNPKQPFTFSFIILAEKSLMDPSNKMPMSTLSPLSKKYTPFFSVLNFSTLSSSFSQAIARLKKFSSSYDINNKHYFPFLVKLINNVYVISESNILLKCSWSTHHRETSSFKLQIFELCKFLFCHMIREPSFQVLDVSFSYKL